MEITYLTPSAFLANHSTSAPLDHILSFFDAEDPGDRIDHFNTNEHLDFGTFNGIPFINVVSNSYGEPDGPEMLLLGQDTLFEACEDEIHEEAWDNITISPHRISTLDFLRSLNRPELVEVALAAS